MSSFPEKVYLNGKILNSESAKISVFDRGFLFGDGIYEVMAQIGGRFFYENAHLDRLNQCLKKIKIDFDISIVSKEIPKLLEAAKLTKNDCLLYIQVTRGVAPRKHGFPKATPPTFMMYAVPKILPEINSIHAKVITSADFRWSRCDIKSTSLLGNVMLNEHAMQQECYESVLFRNGVITEASHCNVFFVKEDIVYTHPANEFILDGITRQVVLEICQNLKIEVLEKGVSKNKIPEMDEAFLTGTSTQIASIRQIDEHHFYENTEIGNITKRIQQAFLELKKAY